MSYEHKVNSGSLFKNEKKINEKQPDYTGEANIDGKVKRLAGWINKTSTGKTYLNIKIEEPQKRDQQETPPSQNTSIDVNNIDPDKIDDVLPF